MAILENQLGETLNVLRRTTLEMRKAKVIFNRNIDFTHVSVDGIGDTRSQ